MNKQKQLPYGVSDYISIRESNLYYVDKTMYLPMMEDAARFLFFIRPRRFGKSLFINMMRAYYDKALKGRFDELFGGTWIGEHPTALQGRYQVLHFDFSRIGSKTETLSDEFNNYCNAVLDSFMHTYADEYPEDVKTAFFDAPKANRKLNILNLAASKLGIPLYLIIDEYDYFTNVVLNKEGEEVYHAITHADGFYRDVFKLFKGMFERIFLIGVSPVTLDDLTSGFNIATNISMNPVFDKMLGFSTEEVREMFTYFKESGQLHPDCDIEAMIEEMKPWYDGYCFTEECLESDVRVFNSDMVLYYLRSQMQTGHAPKQMIDPNTKTDYNKMKRILQLDLLSGDRKHMLKRITEEGRIMGSITESFPARMLTEPNMFISLLFYYGMLTIGGTFGEQLILTIPNNNVRKQYYGYLLEMYQDQHNIDTTYLSTLYTYMAMEGKWEDALHYIADAYAALSSVRDAVEGERNLQGFLLAYLSLTNYYYTAPELELNHGFCDFFLLPDLTHYQSKHSYILELKYLSKKDFAEKAEAQWAEAVEQIKGYAVAPRVEKLRQGTTLHKIVMQFEGWDLRRMEEIE